MTRFNRSSTAMLAAGAALLVVAGTWTTARGNGDPPAGVDVVQSRLIDDTPIVRPQVDDEPALSSQLPPLSLIPPAPMPKPMVGPRPPFTGSLMFHDLATGETIEIPAPAASGAQGGAGGGYDGAYGGGGSEVGSPLGGFSDLTLIENPGDFPWRMNCKLAMHFTDEDGGSFWVSGSGAMIDAETVVTAGHCVYTHYSPQGIGVFSFADEVLVFPGWDGVENTEAPADVEHFGVGRGIYCVAGSEWVQFADLDGDCGLIILDRGVGMLTGWYGWSWGQTCDWIQSRTFHNVGYPQEGCHDGTDMYYWSGTVDSCPGNQMQVDTSGGCYGAAWGGMSGGGVYWNDNGTRRVHAIHSASDRDAVWHSCILYENFVNLMTSTIIPTARGDDFDLQALDVDVGPYEVDTGGQLSQASFFAANPTNGAASGTWTYRVYLSDDGDVSDEDTLLGTYSFNYSFGPMSVVQVDIVPPPTIPEDTPPDSYRIGVILDPATDIDASNNDTDWWDAPPIEVSEFCLTPPSWDIDISPSTDWQTTSAVALDPGRCQVIRISMIPGYAYDFSLCAQDDVGGWAIPGDADLSMYDQDGDLLWHINGNSGCSYDASTIGTIYERWSPPAEGNYYLRISESLDSYLTYQLAYKYISLEHCYDPPDYDVQLEPASIWQTTSSQSIDAPGACRVYVMYLSSSLDYDFSINENDGSGGWMNPGAGNLSMLNAAGTVLWTIDGNRLFDATTIGTPYEGWSPPLDYAYFLVVDNDDAVATYQLAYRITPGAPPPNDDCADVTPVPLYPGSPVAFSGVNIGATIDSNLPYPEVWHAFTTTECVDLTLAYCGTHPAHESVYLLLKDACPALGPNLVASDWENVTCGSGNVTMSWDSLSPGTYWYPVISRIGSEGTYDIEVSALPCGGCPGDADGNGSVNFQDLLVLLAEWGVCAECDSDFDGNGDVDFQDLLILLAAWGAC